MASGAGLPEASKHTEAFSPWTFVVLAAIFYLLSLSLKLALNAYAWAGLTRPGGQAGEGSRTNTPYLTQLVANFLHLRMSHLWSMLQFNEGSQPPVAGTWLSNR